MAKYANRTCYKCGIRKPQPQMYQDVIYNEVGKSKASLSTATFVGSMLGDKASGRALNRWFWNSNQRTYKRKRTVWVCGSCSGSVSRGKLGAAFRGLVNIFVIIIVLLIIIGINAG